jgi:hypothetical protein
MSFGRASSGLFIFYAEGICGFGACVPEENKSNSGV